MRLFFIGFCIVFGISSNAVSRSLGNNQNRGKTYIQKDTSKQNPIKFISLDSLKNVGISIDSNGNICFENNLIKLLEKSNGKGMEGDKAFRIGNALFYNIFMYQRE